MISATQFLNLVASPLVEELKAIEALKRFTTNTDVIGAHAEAVVRRLVRRVVEPLRVSTGAVISEELPTRRRSLSSTRLSGSRARPLPYLRLATSVLCRAVARWPSWRSNGRPIRMSARS